jgi:hypothetical protein
MLTEGRRPCGCAAPSLTESGARRGCLVACPLRVSWPWWYCLINLRQFLQSIDCESTMRVRVSNGFSIAILKGLIGIHQGEVSSPMKYGISTDTLLRYPAFLADQHDAGISLTTIHFGGQTLPLEGTLTIDTPRGALTRRRTSRITQKGRLVAIVFADDLFMIARNIFI